MPERRNRLEGKKPRLDRKLEAMTGEVAWRGWSRSDRCGRAALAPTGAL